MPDPQSSADGSRSAQNRRFNRRNYLKGVGAAAAGGAILPLASGRSSATVERHGIEFERTVDMGDAIDEHGSWSAAIEAEAQDDTLLEFPPGEYFIDDHVYFATDDDFLKEFDIVPIDGTISGNLGMVGKGGRGDVRFVAPDDHRANWFSIYGASKFLWENIDWDATGENQAGTLRLIPNDKLHVEDLELIGSTHAPDPVPEPEGAWSFTEQAIMIYSIVLDPDGEGVVKNVVAKTGGGVSPEIDKRESLKGYARRGRRGAFYIGGLHQGRLKFIDCQIEEFGSHGIYGGGAPGEIQVEGGIWRNNDNSQIRITGPDSYIEDARIEVDISQVDDDSPTVVEDGGYRDMKGVWWQYRGDTPGGEIRDTDIFYTEHPDVVSGYNDDGDFVTRSGSASDAIHMRSRGAGVTLENTRFYVKPDEARAIRAPKPTGVPSGKVAIEIRNSSITGPSGRGETAPETILIKGRPESSIVDSCIHQTGADKDGVKIVDSDRTVVRDSRINVNGEATVVENSDDVEIESIKEVGSCPRPRGPRNPDEDGHEPN